ncbi:hypothetical protein QZH41_003168 [Actinostola sp. cb2023]|nr:hypothetical protein QZH41_003168 [Actinostola sp. cb2023]
MVKLNAAHESHEGREATDKGCYICGASNPNWHVYSKPPNNSIQNPFFPFLEYHEAPVNAWPMEKERGKVDICAVCFSFLTQQWRAFEDKGTPVVKRIYWLKRPGHGTFEGFDKDDDPSGDSQESNLMDNDVCEQRQHSKVKRPTDDQNPTEPPLVETHFDDQKDGDATTEPSFSNDNVEPTVPCDNKKETSLEFCFVCSRQKPKEFMRSVHTRPQLKTETPFYPCLTKHSPAVCTTKMDFLGKVLVCEACQKFLFRQWQSQRAHLSSHIPNLHKPVIVIDSSDSEDDGLSIAKHRNKHTRSGRHANVSPMHYTASASPGVTSQPPAPTKDYPISGSPSTNMQPSNSRSFAAALRKLAKQAMPPGTSSPATSSPSGSQPASPTVSHASSRSTDQSEPGMLSEHYTGDHGHPVVPYYLHGGRPEVPLFIPRAGPLPGPPPLLGSKRDGADPHGVSPFFQGAYPPPSDGPLSSISGRSDCASPQNNTPDKEKSKDGGASESHEHIPMGHRMFYYNENKPSSCPVHGHSPGESHHKHSSGRTDQIPVSKPDRPEEFNRIFLPPHPDGAALMHPYLVHGSRDGPYGPHHLGERQAELYRERERQTQFDERLLNCDIHEMFVLHRPTTIGMHAAKHIDLIDSRCISLR